jgi:hypothetical protein
VRLDGWEARTLEGRQAVSDATADSSAACRRVGTRPSALVGFSVDFPAIATLGALDRNLP